MLEDAIIVGTVMTLTEVIKYYLKKRVDEQLVGQFIPIVVMVLAGALNVANGLIFEPGISVTEALAAGLRLGAIAGGIFSMGKSLLGK